MNEVAEARGIEPRRCFSPRLHLSGVLPYLSAMLPKNGALGGIRTPRLPVLSRMHIPVLLRAHLGGEREGRTPKGVILGGFRDRCRRRLSACLSKLVACEGVEPPDQLSPQTALQAVPAPYWTTTPTGRDGGSRTHKISGLSRAHIPVLLRPVGPRGWTRTSNLQALDLTPLPIGLRTVELSRPPRIRTGTVPFLKRLHLPIVLEAHIYSQKRKRSEVLGNDAHGENAYASKHTATAMSGNWIEVIGASARLTEHIT
jgi:hypothetical protein